MPLLEETPGQNNYPACLNNLQWQKLDRIRVEKPDGSLIKSFTMKYSDNADNTSNRGNERLTLLSVTEIGNDGQTKPPYQFSYYHSLNGLPLPQYGENMSDHWGYFCNRYADIGTTNFYDQKAPNTTPSTYLRGLLTQIIYPTGGGTQFEYEQHRYSKKLDKIRWNSLISESTDQDAGGVRIKKVISFATTSTDNPIIKEYLYLTGYNKTASIPTLRASGILGGQAQYTYSDYQMKLYNSSYLLSRDLFSYQSVLPACHNADGSHVGYSEVVEKRSDGGYTSYFFSNFDNSHTVDGQPVALRLDEAPLSTLLVSRTPYDQYSSTDEERGKLIREEMFNTAGRMVRKREIEYIALNKSVPNNPNKEEFARGITAGGITPCPNSSEFMIAATAYKLYTYSYLPAKETETKYADSGTGSILTTTNYTYNDLRLVSTRVTRDSKGIELSTIYKYPNDFTFPSSVTAGTASSAVKSMRSEEQHMPAFPIETLTLRDGKVVNAFVQTYRAFGPNGSVVQPYQAFQLETTTPLTLSSAPATPAYSRLVFSTTTPVFDPHLSLKATAAAYDSFGHLLEMNYEGGVNTSYLWGYDSTLPIAEATNTPWDRLFHTSFESNSLGGWTCAATNIMLIGGKTGNQAYLLNGGTGVSRTNLPTDEDFVLSFWAKPEPPATLAPSVVLTSGNGTLATIRSSIGQADAQGWQLYRYYVRFTSSASNLIINVTVGNQLRIDEVRLHPVGAVVKTFTHDLTAGVTSITDPNYQSVFYQYDEFQRLKQAKDGNGNILKHYEYHYKR